MNTVITARSREQRREHKAKRGVRFGPSLRPVCNVSGGTP